MTPTVELRKSEQEELALAISRATADQTRIVKIDIDVARRIQDTMRKPT